MGVDLKSNFSFIGFRPANATSKNGVTCFRISIYEHVPIWTKALPRFRIDIAFCVLIMYSSLTLGYLRKIVKEYATKHSRID